jgi:ABC-type nitrate/sulfonate/bicarbonate transport system ATPase subunit
MLELKEISFSYRDHLVLKDLNLIIQKHSFHSLIGMSGAGKTLILKLISGLLKLQSGSIHNDHARVSFVFQNPEIFPWLTIEKNLQLCTSLVASEIETYLKTFRLEHTSKLFPHQLSGGTLKKVALLRAFLMKADLILMDEPFAYLDLAQKEEIYTFTMELWKQYRPTIVFVTHDLDEAIFLSSRISYLSKKDKTIIDSYQIDFEKDSSFNSSKLKHEHNNYYGQIYNKLKGELV